MPTSKQRLAYERGRDEVARLAHRGLGRLDFARGAADALRKAVAFDGACWHTADPATRLITSHYTDLSGEGFPWILRNEYLQDDVNKFAALAGRRCPAATLTQATGGRPESSARYRELYRPRGWGDEVRASFDIAGTAWGSVMMLRAAGRPRFTAADAVALGSLSRHVAHGLRTAMLTEAQRTARTPDEPGFLVLDERDEVEMMSASAGRWLAEIDDMHPSADGWLPASVVSVAVRARAIARGATAPGGPARLRLRTRSGRWLVLHGSVTGDRRAAVIVEAASPGEVAPLIVEAYGLTRREREVLGAVVRGASTQAIAARLSVSPHTIQDHLKSIFDKTGVRSRRELVGRLFYEHFEPAVMRDVPLAADGWFAER